ncbi:electron transport complex subunit RsxA [bacterium]|nr:electron transport complex subunit RsxA [bacterium]MBU0899865.1 electron transport complex subunit RsxA [bacterium]MBU1153023.1 electron transport complex subunit RsxA [bacterium]MBU1782086.1 electron transport complex subunit RsxA [bacterium]MBU2599790.1 electron transport complex subunit RsxA [bacterium]
MDLKELGTIFISAALINNFVFTKYLGLCIFFGISKRMDISISMGIAVTFVMVLSSILGGLIYHFALVPFHIEFMRIVVFIIVIACCVQFIEMIVKKHLTTHYHMWGVYLLLIATNCIVLSIPLINVENKFNLIQSVVNAFGSGVGFALAIILMASIREKADLADLPESLKGFAFAFIAASCLALAFFGFSGLIKPLAGGI